MQYNTEIRNTDPLPIAYIEQHGERNIIRQLYTKSPLRLQSNCVKINSENQIVVEQIGRSPKYIFQIQCGLEIVNVDVASVEVKK